MGFEQERREECGRVNRAAWQRQASGGSEGGGGAFGTCGEQLRNQISVMDIHSVRYWKTGLGSRKQGTPRE